jgi:aryl-alcohol dehydrogenase (NADP+)
MKYRNLGRSGLKVSPICLGTMEYGGEADPETAKRLIARAADHGINMIDTANVYTGGQAEEIIGEALLGSRDQWVLSTKTRNDFGVGPNVSGLSRKQIHRAIDGSLTRLRTDYIDIYYLHYEDLTAPLAESVRAMADLIHAGKIRYFGVANFRSWRIAEICRICDDLGIDRPVVSSPLYNIVNRRAEIEQLPACNYFGVGVVSYSPLARSVLSGIYRPGEEPEPGSRGARKDMRLVQNEWRPESIAIAQKVKARAEARGITASQFAVAWLLNNWLLTGVIAGAATEAQLDDYVNALDYAFTPEDEAFVDSLVAVGSQSTHGHNDPWDPLEGRQPRYAPRFANSFVDDIKAALLEAHRGG